jgi:hypothetical protein
MSDDVFAKMATGMAGRFWSLVDGEPKDPDFHGFIRRDDDGYWVVELEGGRSAPDDADLEGRFADAMVGVLGGGTVFLSDRQRWRHTPASVGQRIDVIQLWFATAVTGVDVNNVKADGIVLAESRFPNQRPWAEYEQPDWRHRDASDPLGQGVSLDLPAGAEATLSVGNRMTLTVLPTWWARPEIDQWHIGTGLSLALSSPEPTPSKVYVETLEWLQDLISLCWGGRVLPVPGKGKVNDAEDGKFWAQSLFDAHHGELANLSHPFPAVRLGQLGGPRAFVRWLILCRYYSRATRGVAEGMYVGASVETRVLNTMSAVAYWVGRHHGSEPWARVHLSNKHNSNQLWRLVKHLLPTFQDWVGDGEVFSKRLWWDYDQLRHNPAHSIDYGLIHAFTIGARLMLISALLNKVAGSTVPSERFAKHYWQVGDALRELLSDQARCAVP